MALCGIILLVVSRNDALQHCMAFLAIVSLCLSKQQPTAVFCSMSHHATALFFVWWPSSLCRNHVSLCHGKKQCATAFCSVVPHSTARNNVLLHSMALHIMVNHAIALFAVPWPCFVILLP